MFNTLQGGMKFRLDNKNRFFLTYGFQGIYQHRLFFLEVILHIAIFLDSGKKKT